ncbi:hypothetical protein [Streptomyces roseoverticillatus]|uniref:hypothetical protein n=1 Tax=Streptomyces roseoverticillatus TaxID=66429 RepID=UPI0004C25442|nr:hypothetical protein [Streptomyces roseoverticillatus]
MSDKLIVPIGIPQFTGNLAELEKNAASLAKDAKAFRDAGAAVHSTFQGLSAHYKAPEAEQLFATTAPVATKSDGFADDLEKVVSALNAYRAEVQPLKTKLENLKAEALRFVESIEGDDDWRKDQKKVDHNNDLWRDVNATADAFNAAERSCHDKIVALVGGKSLIPDDGTHKPNMYGYKASDLDHAEETPWGSLAERKYTGLAWLGHQIKSFVWDGFIVDGVWGTIKGLGTLVGTDGWKAAGQAWTGLAKLATGIVITAVPVAGSVLWSTPEDKLPSWLRDSRRAVKETGKALIAYDQWGKNPARAAGAVSFNVLTTVFTGGSGAAAKGGAAAKAISVAAKVRYLDATTYVGMAGKFGLTKVGDMMSTLKNLRGSGATLRIADDTFKLADQAPPVRPAGLPDSASPVMGDKGKVVWVDEKTGALFNEHGKTLQPAHEVPKEPSAAERAAAAPKRAPEKAEVMAGVSVRTGSEAKVALGHLDDGIPRGGAGAGGTAAHVPEGAAREVPGGPRNHAPGGSGSHPSGGPAGHRPGGPADDLGRGPSANHEPSTGSGPHSAPSRTGGGVGSGLPERGGLSRSADDGMGAGRHATAGPGNIHGAGHAADSGAHGNGHATEGAGGLSEGGARTGQSGAAGGERGHGSASDRYRGMSDQEIMRHQVDRANNEPGYFEDYYKSNGNRLSTKIADDSGNVPPQLVKDRATGKWVAVDDAPPPVPEKYYGGPEKRGRDTPLLTDEALKKLDESAKARHSAVAADQVAEKVLEDAQEAFKGDRTSVNEAAVVEAKALHKPLHGDMTKATEAYGEAVAEHHVIPEHYPKSTREVLDGPANGNDQFDQVWRRKDGGFVVVEAKSSTKTQLGPRKLPNGTRVMQGTRQYFFDILREMRVRGRENPNELKLAEELEAALDEGKLDYILVKGNPNGVEHAGYAMRKFDIG